MLLDNYRDLELDTEVGVSSDSGGVVGHKNLVQIDNTLAALTIVNDTSAMTCSNDGGSFLLLCGAPRCLLSLLVEFMLLVGQEHVLRKGEGGFLSDHLVNLRRPKSQVVVVLRMMVCARHLGFRERLMKFRQACH